MFYDYLNDISFLQKLDEERLHTTYAKLILLSFDEKPLREIQGEISQGSMSVNGSSAVRRTINLTMLASIENSDIENLDNEISINKKVQIFIGLENHIKGYESYGEIVWFPLGVYILSSANVTRNTNGWSIAISGKDKMCRLDGTCGGTLPATTTFHERLVQAEDGTYTTEYPTIYQIIFEAVNHFGGEIAENIIITDIDDQIKLLVKYMGKSPIYFSDEYNSMRFTASDDFPNMYSYGEDIGYKMTDFTYPGELVLKAGDTVVSLLEKIKNTLGNYEYFYDVWGNFVFQEVKNYLNTGSPLTELVESNYTKSYNNAKYLYDLTKLDTTTQITKSPKYDNIKNDFYVWGQRETSEGAKIDIRYHLVVDQKPLIDLAASYMWEVRDTSTGLIVRYDFNDSSSYEVEGYETTLIGSPCNEWREELYRLALVAQVTNSVNDSYYDSELIAEWRKLYDPIKWTSTNGWNPAVYTDPDTLHYWLDFIDSGSAAIGGYSVNQIGRRTKVINDTSVKSIYNKEVPDIVFIEGYNQDLITQYAGIGQKYFVLMPEYYELFQTSSRGASCFDRIRDMMYQNLSYNTTITLTCLPKYYMEPNNIIHIEDADMSINANYQITQFTIPLTYNGTMNITATQVLSRV